jgi:hypothetical protein
MQVLAILFEMEIESIGYLEKFCIYKVASLPLVVMLRPCWIKSCKGQIRDGLQAIFYFIDN